MAKGIYEANVEFTQGSTIKTLRVEFITEEKNIDSIKNIFEQNKKALQYVKSQNKKEIEDRASGKYTKLTVRGVSKKGIARGDNKSLKKNTGGFFKFLNVLDRFLGD